MATNYDIDYNDKRFTQVEAEKNSAITEVDKTYGDMISKSDKYYDSLIQESKDWAETQKENQQAQTDFAIEKIEQQKEQQKKDYIKEQSGAYVDWQKQSDPYGVNAEKMADQGLQKSGYSESSLVSMYNTYQNRVAIAREAYVLAVQNYDNMIKEAQLQNNSILAEIAHNALKEQLELGLQGFQYKNTLIIEKANKKQEIDNTYYGRYQDVIAQINQENALAEQVRQHNEEMAYKNAALAEEKRQFNETMAYNKSKSSGGSGGGSGGSSGGSSKITKSSGSESGSASVNKSSSGSSGSAEIDMQSVLALGYGPISASRLAELENQGLITSYTSGGKIKFKKSAYTVKQSMLLK